MGTRIFQVVVRGHFHDLGEAQREVLLTQSDEHEIFRAAYTRDGTLTYEPNLVAFSFRYEIRNQDDSITDTEAEADVTDLAKLKALASLAAMGVGHRRLRVSATNMASIWR